MFAKTSIFALAATAALLPATFAQISDDFESGWSNDTWPVYAPDCSGGGTVTLDSTTAHSGKNSMKVVGGSDGYCGHVFFGTTKVPAGGDVYVRTWLKHKTALSDSHVTFIVMPDSGLDGKHLRVSGQEEIIEYNRESDDATMPDLSPDGVSSTVGLPVDEWQCFEYHLSSDGTIQTWLNSKEVAGLSFDPAGTNANANGWGTTYKPDITGVYFGWESYAGSSDTFWYDDVAIAATRVGCAAAGAATSSASGKPSSSAVSSKAPVSSTKAVSTVKLTTSSAAPATSSVAVSAVKPATSSSAIKPATTSSVVKPATSSSAIKTSTPASSTAVAPASTSVAPSSSAAASSSSTAPASSAPSSLASSSSIASPTSSVRYTHSHHPSHGTAPPAPVTTSSPATAPYPTGLSSSSTDEDCFINYVTVFV
ncbi:hypothetical protein LTR17_009102 [Elasticomyces elasticus]|nr:hypothetical protein LTR17_009102 [Elasticomyces elasticus]